VTLRLLPPAGNGQPIPTGQNPVGGGGAGVWTCSATTMTMHPSNSTGTVELRFARPPMIIVSVARWSRRHGRRVGVVAIGMLSLTATLVAEPIAA
jgi:hypothetical protein